MKERPIIFSAPMVRAILDGTKTQTRRVVKLKPWQQIEERDDGAPWPWMYDDDRAGDHWLPCPYGQAGDRLWVREEWGCHWMYDDVPACECRSKHPGDNYWYRADPPGTPGTHGCPFDGYMNKWRRAIHMPRFASRITLGITSVRVERLQDISEADAAAEGVTPKWEPGCSGRLMEALGGFSFRPAASAYADLWESLHGPGSWDANPWVWVIEFRRITQAGPQP